MSRLRPSAHQHFLPSPQTILSGPAAWETPGTRHVPTSASCQLASPAESRMSSSARSRAGQNQNRFVCGGTIRACLSSCFPTTRTLHQTNPQNCRFLNSRRSLTLGCFQVLGDPGTPGGRRAGVPAALCIVTKWVFRCGSQVESRPSRRPASLRCRARWPLRGAGPQASRRSAPWIPG